jgi:hypothetical protein
VAVDVALSGAGSVAGSSGAIVAVGVGSGSSSGARDRESAMGVVGWVAVCSSVVGEVGRELSEPRRGITGSYRIRAPATCACLAGGDDRACKHQCVDEYSRQRHDGFGSDWDDLPASPFVEEMVTGLNRWDTLLR